VKRLVASTHDHQVGAFVDGNGAARREHFTSALLKIPRLGVGHRDEAGFDRLELELAPAAGDGQLALLVQVGHERDANDVALAHHAELLRLQHGVERLVPGHVAHADGDLTVHVVGGHDVHVADVGDEAQDVVNVRILEVEVDATTGEAAALLLGRHARQEGSGLVGLAAPLAVEGVGQVLERRLIGGDGLGAARGAAVGAHAGV
jgi:hypothetical protein